MPGMRLEVDYHLTSLHGSVVTKQAGPGAVLGWRSLLLSSPANATVTAIEESLIYAIKADIFYEVAAKSPCIARGLVEEADAELLAAKTVLEVR
jgi:CRP-like cAMP-binding protein